MSKDTLSDSSDFIKKDPSGGEWWFGQTAIRNLWPSEFNGLYQKFILEDKKSQNKRIGVAVFLKADLIDMYGAEYPKWADEKIEKLAKKFEEMEKGTNEYEIAMAKIKNLESNYLGAPGEEVKNITEASKEDVKREAKFDLNPITFFKMTVAPKAKRVEKEARMKAKISEEKRKYRQKKQEKQRFNFAKNFNKEGKKRYREWVKNNIVRYLSAIFSNHKLSSLSFRHSLMTYETPARNEVIRMVENNKITGPDGCKLYRQILDEVLLAKSPSDFIRRKNKLISQYKSVHPLLKKL